MAKAPQALATPAPGTLRLEGGRRRGKEGGQASVRQNKGPLASCMNGCTESEVHAGYTGLSGYEWDTLNASEKNGNSLSIRD